MKFSLSTEPIVDTTSMSSLEMASMTNDLMTAYESLDNSIKELNEVQAVMENITVSINLLKQYGDSAVCQLNIDKGLESLLGLEESMITAQKAIEGLGDAAKGAWETLKRWVMKIWLGLKTFLKALFNKLSSGQYKIQLYLNSVKTCKEFNGDKHMRFATTYNDFIKGIDFLDKTIGVILPCNKSIQDNALEFLTSLEGDYPEVSITSFIDRCQKSADAINSVLKGASSDLKIEIVNDTFVFTENGFHGRRVSTFGETGVANRILNLYGHDEDKTYAQHGWTKESTERALGSYITVLGKLRPFIHDDKLETKMLAIVSAGEKSGKIDKKQSDAIKTTVRTIHSFFKICALIEWQMCYELDNAIRHVVEDCVI